MSIKFNPSSITTTTNTNLKNTNTDEVKENSKETKKIENKEVSEKDTFAYLAGAAAYNMANISLSPQTLVNKYNSPEAIARIEAMMGNFVDGTVEGLAKFEEEFGATAAWTNLSDADKLAAAADFYASQSV